MVGLALLLDPPFASSWGTGLTRGLPGLHGSSRADTRRSCGCSAVSGRRSPCASARADKRAVHDPNDHTGRALTPLDRCAAPLHRYRDRSRRRHRHDDRRRRRRRARDRARDRPRCRHRRRSRSSVGERPCRTGRASASMSRMTGRTDESPRVETPGAEAPSAITVSGLRKTYGDTVAVDDASFTSPTARSSGSWDPTGPARPRPSNV